MITTPRRRWLYRRFVVRDDVRRGPPMFSPVVAERIGWYVYALRDPRDGRLFYVGKGVGNRVFQHAQAELAAGGSQEGLSTESERISKGVVRAVYRIDQ
jgi:hypothetical protein